MQQKTGLPVQFEITEQTRESISNWINHAELMSDEYLFSSRNRSSSHISTRQYARLVDKWVRDIGLDPAEYGTHSMRRTKASLIYRRTKNLRAVQILLGHTKMESTIRYLGIEVEDALGDGGTDRNLGGKCPETSAAAFPGFPIADARKSSCSGDKRPLSDVHIAREKVERAAQPNNIKNLLMIQVNTVVSFRREN